MLGLRLSLAIWAKNSGHYPLICSGLKTLDALRVPPAHPPPEGDVADFRRKMPPNRPFLGPFDPRGASRSGASATARPAFVLAKVRIMVEAPRRKLLIKWRRL